MKPRITIAILIASLFFTTGLAAQKSVRVEALSNDISYNLDLKAVASVFADSRDLEEFEIRLNDYNNQLSNLDLNNDGEVDYLRVVELKENNTHLVVIQAVVGYDLYQDVATIAVERKAANRTYVQVIGDPYIYGRNYIIEPVFIRTPVIFSFFWGPRYHRWHSPYYWGYYPRHYHHRHPVHVNVYVSHIHVHVNTHHRYNYTTKVRSRHIERMHQTVSRNDYARRHPESSFNRRNENVNNKRDITVRSNSVRPSTRPSQTVRQTPNTNRNSNSTRVNSSASNADRTSGVRGSSPANSTRNSSSTRVNSSTPTTNKTNKSGTRVSNSTSSTRNSNSSTRVNSSASNAYKTDKSVKVNNPTSSSRNSSTRVNSSVNNSTKVNKPTSSSSSRDNAKVNNNAVRSSKSTSVSRSSSTSNTSKKSSASKSSGSSSKRESSSSRSSRR